MSVYKAINAVQAELSRSGITKDRTNTQGSGYKFRGIDDVYNALAPLLSKHGLCILPRVLTRQCDERQSKAGGALFYVTVEVEFDFVCANDGSKHTVKTFGEAMDSGDKATNKAMSAAYKYAAFQAFSIPTEADNDADGNSHEAVARRTQWINDKLDAIAAAPNVGALKKIMDEALAKVRENNDIEAEDRLHAASLAKVSNAKAHNKQEASLQRVADEAAYQ